MYVRATVCMYVPRSVSSLMTSRHAQCNACVYPSLVWRSCLCVVCVMYVGSEGAMGQVCKEVVPLSTVQYVCNLKYM